MLGIDKDTAIGLLLKSEFEDNEGSDHHSSIKVPHSSLGNYINYQGEILKGEPTS